MLTRIRLRRTKSSLNSLSNNANENHHLRYGEALYSFADNMMVVGTETDQVISNIPNRIIAFPKVTKNVIFAGPTSGSAAFPTFRALVAADIPTGIPASKITGIQTYSAGAGISISNAGVISNSGVRSVATGSTNGTIQVNTNGTTSNVAVKGLGSAAYQPTTAFQAPLKTLTFNDSGSGSASAVNYNGNAAMTISYNTIGAASSSHKHIVNLATTSSTSDELGVTGLLSVSNGGTGRNGFVNPNAVVISNPSRPTTGAVYQIRSNSGAFYSTGQDVQPGFGTLPVAQGGTGKTTFTNKNSVIVANASTGDGILNSIRSTSGAFYSTGTDSTPQFGTLPVAQGGTGKASWTANQLVYATATNALGQLAPAQANQVIMSDANKKPTWSDPSNLITTSLENTYVWDTVTYDSRYSGSEGNLASSYYIGLEHALGNDYGGYVTLSPLSAATNKGSDWSNYKTLLQNLNYSITIYSTCTKSFDGGNIIYTLTGVEAQKTFPYIALTGNIGSDYVVPSNGYVRDADALVYTPPGEDASKRKCYIVAGIHGENYQITNPGIPTRLGIYNTNWGCEENESTNWILSFHGHKSGSRSANLGTLKCYAFQCLLPVSGAYRVASCLQVAITGDTWGFVSDYDVDVSFSYYMDKDPQINYISQNWATTTGTYNAMTHGFTKSGTSKTFRLRRGSLMSRLSGKMFLGSRVGNDASSFRISFSETKSGSTIYVIPRLIVYGNQRWCFVIDTANLDAGTLQPVCIADSPTSTAITTASWFPAITNTSTSSTCTQLTISIASSSTSYNYIDYFNKAGESYTYYGFA